MEGVSDAVFHSAVYTNATKETHDEANVSITAENVACVFHAAQTLTVEELRTGYRRIGAVKRLKCPAAAAVDYPVSNTPLGVVFCIDSASSLETIAEEMMELNKAVPSSEWPDMVVVLQRGTVNYAIQFEGDRIRGDFLLPNITDFPVMPMYVHLFARGLALHSLNRLCSFLFMHLQVFSPGTKLPP